MVGHATHFKFVTPHTLSETRIVRAQKETLPSMFIQFWLTVNGACITSGLHTVPSITCNLVWLVWQASCQGLEFRLRKTGWRCPARPQKLLFCAITFTTLFQKKSGNIPVYFLVTFSFHLVNCLGWLLQVRSDLKKNLNPLLNFKSF